MTTEFILDCVAVSVSIIGLIVSLCAVFDVRAQVKRLIQLERKRVFTRTRNDMVWQFVEPTELSHTPEIAKGLEEFSVLSMTLDEQQTPDLTNHALNNEALMFAEKLVENGFAVWQPEWDRDKLAAALRQWQSTINSNRLRNILGEEQSKKSLT
jgi:hypothetical protein